MTIFTHERAIANSAYIEFACILGLAHIVVTKVFVFLQILWAPHLILLLAYLLSKGLVSVESAIIVWMHIDSESSKHFVDPFRHFVPKNTVLDSV